MLDGLSSSQLTKQPSLGELPVPHDRVRRDLQHAGRFLDTQSAKETQLDDATLALVDLRERFERVIESDQVVRPLVRSAQLFDERHLHGAAAALLILPRSRVIDEDATHQAGGHREEVRAILPVDALHVHEPYVRLVHQRRGLKRVTRPLTPHAPFGDAMKLVLDERNEPLERCRVAFPPCDEQRGDVYAAWSADTAGVSFHRATPQSVLVPAKLRLKPRRNRDADGLRFAATQCLLAPLRGARHLLRPSEKLASFVTILAMGIRRSIACGMAVLGLIVATSGHAASTFASRTNHLTFSGPVGLPGVALARGTYTFLVIEAHPDIVRVQSRDGSAIYFTGFTRLVERPAGLRRDRMVTFAETPRGVPSRIDRWYPVGESTGRQFIYVDETR